MVDPPGDIRFANPAAVSALGYDDVAELHGKPSHETIHDKRPDGSHFPVEECPMLAPHQTDETIHHARADSARIEIALADRELTIETTDDGSASQPAAEAP